MRSVIVLCLTGILAAGCGQATLSNQAGTTGGPAHRRNWIANGCQSIRRRGLA